MSIRNMLIALAAPLLMAGACAGNEVPDGTLKVVERQDGVVGIIAQYQTETDAVRIVTRRIVTEVAEAEGSRQATYIEVGAAASDFQVEVTLYDLRRGIRLGWSGDRPELDSGEASAAEKNAAFALFTEAVHALTASDLSIAAAEHRMFGDLLDGISTHPGFTDPIAPAVPYDESRGCGGVAFAPTYHAGRVYGSGYVECDDAGDYETEVCIYSRRLKGVWGSVREFINPFSFDNWRGWTGPIENPFNNDSRQDTEMAKRGCNKKDESHYDANQRIEMTSLDDRADVLCGGDPGGYDYETHVRMVSDEGGWFDLNGTNWEELGRPSRRVTFTCQ